MAVTHGIQPGRKPTSAARAKAGAAIEIAGVRLTNPERVLYPDAGITKREVAEYYVAVADWILPHVVARPLTLLRCPEGVEHQCFYQRHVHESTGPPIRDVAVKEEDGELRYYLAIDDLQGLIALVQSKALELHAWGARAEDIERPDRIVLDLDPAPEVAWSRVVAAAHALRERLEGLGLQSFARTTGGKGLHVVVPVEPRSPWEDAKQFARTIAADLSRSDPGAYVLTATKAKRTGKIYVDYLRNARTASAIVSYSTRARPGAPVATPVRWEELKPALDPRRFTVRTVPRRLKALGADPWDGFFDVRQSLARALKSLARSAR
jgi:bifunctional non-homologous end joining protein LigD